MPSAADALENGVTLDNVKSSLYCVVCNRILRDAVEVSCCHALYCSVCLDPDGVAPYDPKKVDRLIKCHNCGRDVIDTPTPNYPVRRLVGTIPVPCGNEGCSEIVAAGALHQHMAHQCDYTKVGCRFFDRGCAASMLRKENPEHEQQYCVFRDVACPQGCGTVMQWRECADHFLHVCSRTLVDCDVKCGALVERRSLFQHMNECPLKPAPCPYRAIGCTMTHLLRRPELEEHMAMSIHAHLMLVDAKMRSMEVQLQRNMLSERRRMSHDWEPSNIQCVGRWEAQHATIHAMTSLDGLIVTGCEGGELLLLDPFDGRVVRRVQTGDQPIRSLLAMGDGRLVVGRRYHSVLLYGQQCANLIGVATLHPKNVSHSIGVLSLAKGTIDKAVHLSDKPQFFHPELYAVPTCPEDVCRGRFEVVFATTEHHVRVLDSLTLEEVTHIEGHHAAPTTTCLVHDDRFFISGSEDGSICVHDMNVKGFPKLHWLQCFGGSGGVRSLCIHPNGTQWRSPTTRPTIETVADAIVLCIGGGGGDIGFWDFQRSLLCEHTVSLGHKGAVLCMVPVDGTLIATGGADEYWRVWDGRAETSHGDIPGSTYCALAHEGLLYAAGSQGCVRLWTSRSLRYNEKRQPEPQKQIPL